MIIHNPRFVTPTGPTHTTGIQPHDHERDCAILSDEPCRCGHPESAHTELGCGAPDHIVWDMTYGPGPCTCETFRDQEPEDDR